MDDIAKEALELHRKNRGKIELASKIEIRGKEDLSRAYTPGVAAVSQAIADDPAQMRELSPKGNMVAVISDGSAVLGLGNIGPAAAYPVMEGKCLLFKKFAGVDAFPIVLSTQDTDEIVETICNIAEGFGGINLEDIAAPRCFEIERRLNERLNIPVFHDDQHGTAVITLAGLINALEIVGKGKDVKIVVNGAGAAGQAITQLLLIYGFKNIIVLDSQGALCGERGELNDSKRDLLTRTNPTGICGELSIIMKDADVFIGVSRGGLVSKEMVASMADKAIVFAMANPDPEITEADALEAGAAVVATGRSDCPNQLNNVLVFPGIFRGALDAGITQFENKHFVQAAEALASLVPKPTAEKFVPSPFEPDVADTIAKAVQA